MATPVLRLIAPAHPTVEGGDLYRPATWPQRLAEARAAADLVVEAALGGAVVPDVVRELLIGPWRRHLELTHARRGSHSQEWATAATVVAQLILATDRGLLPLETEDAGAILDRIEPELVLGLAMSGLNATRRENIVTRLRVATGTHRTATDTRGDDRAPTRRGATVAADAPDPVAFLESARRLKIGAWLEFIDARGASTRAKLCWASSATGRRLFVDHQGNKLAERTVPELAVELMQGRVVIL